MRRTDLMDTKLEVHRELIRRLRAMTSSQRLQLAIQKMEIGWEIHRLALKRLERDKA